MNGNYTCKDCGTTFPDPGGIDPWCPQCDSTNLVLQPEVDLDEAVVKDDTYACNYFTVCGDLEEIE